MQTGGPDGGMSWPLDKYPNELMSVLDLGSNEILLSSEKYIAIIDGSGVLADPNGINAKNSCASPRPAR